MINILRRAIVILLLAYVGLVTWFWWNQENIIFRGEPLPAAMISVCPRMWRS